MRLTYEGKRHDFTLWDWATQWHDQPEKRDWMKAAASEGDLATDEGEPITGVAEKRLRARLLRTYAHIPRSNGLLDDDLPRRFLISGLWAWGTIPALGGNYKAGKSTVVTDLTRALIVPGYRFLGHFEPADLTEDDRSRGVIVINAETPARDFEDGVFDTISEGEWARVYESGIGDVWERLRVEHLEELGGANLMDLTDPDIYDLWVHRLADCADCEGADDRTPSTVIVDGVTAILQAAGKDVDDFGKWYAAFRRLLRECDIPNGLATGHNTMSGGHLMGGTGASAGPDGLWAYSAVGIDDPVSPRRFSVQPRMGGVAVKPTSVVLNEVGRPVVKASPNTRGKTEPVEDLAEVIAQRTAEYVREHPGASGQELTDNVEDGGWKENNLAGRAKAIDLGLIREEQCKPGCTLCEKSHHRRTHFWPVES